MALRLRLLATMGLLLAVGTPALAANSLDGQWAFWPADDFAAADPAIGVGTDRGCRRFLKSADYAPQAAENLTIANDQWQTRQKASDVRGKVRYVRTDAGKIKFTIQARHNGRVIPTTGTIERDGISLTIVTRNAVNHAQVYNFCRVK